MKRCWLSLPILLPLVALLGCNGGNSGNSQSSCTCGGNAGQPAVTLNTPAAGATQLSGCACNIDPAKNKVVIYALTNEWYVQPLINAPFTNIATGGSWTSSTNPWQSIVVLLVDPANYTPAATKITNPALDVGVLAWTQYPPGSVECQLQQPRMGH